MNKAYKRCFALILVLALAFPLSGCTTYKNFHAAFFEKDKEQEVITIGVFEPQTGSDAAEAAEEIRGIELAHELYPEVMGKRVDLLYADNQSDVDMARTAAQQLVDSGVRLVLGSYKSTLSLAGSDIFDAADLPAIGISIKNPIVTQTNEFYFRVCFVDAFQGISAAHYVHDYLRQNDAVCFKQAGDDYADTMIEQFRQRMDRLTAGTGTVTVLEYPEGTEDFSVYLKRVGATGFKAVFFPCASSVGYKVLYQASPMGLRWIGCAKWEDLQETAKSELGEENVAFLNGVTFVKGFDAASSVTPMTDTFKNAYKEKYGDDDPSENCALGFDAYLMALEGIRLSEDTDDGVILTSKLKSIRNLEGATGYISINSQGDPTKDVVIEVITSKGSAVVYTVTPN
ncbi:MAG: ABC transporter substrate-binding protein [Firmicutes bacterium]|nr:ABC transporter substrate-binding protein [Bacillota bacterium]